MEQDPKPVQADDDCFGAASNRPLSEIAGWAAEHVAECVAKHDSTFPELADLPECVYISNAQGVVVYSNNAHRKYFSPDASPLGRTKRGFLSPEVAARAEKIDSLILDGAPYVESQNIGLGPNGLTYRVTAFTQSLLPLKAPGLAILVVLRLRVSEDEATLCRRVSLSAANAAFRKLSGRDQDICRQTALGVSSRQLGERFGITTRGVELRKQKAFAKLGVAKAVDLARLLTRLQDHGYVDLGL